MIKYYGLFDKIMIKVMTIKNGGVSEDDLVL